RVRTDGGRESFPGVIPLDEIRAARERLRGIAVRTPLVRLNTDDGAPEIWIKLEHLQPIGSFKLRRATNAMLPAGAPAPARGARGGRAPQIWRKVWPARRGRSASRSVASCPSTRQKRSPRQSRASGARSSKPRSAPGGM